MPPPIVSPRTMRPSESHSMPHLSAEEMSVRRVHAIASSLNERYEKQKHTTAVLKRRADLLEADAQVRGRPSCTGAFAKRKRASRSRPMRPHAS